MNWLLGRLFARKQLHDIEADITKVQTMSAEDIEKSLNLMEKYAAPM